MKPSEALSELGIPDQPPGPPGGRLGAGVAQRITGKMISYDQLVDELLLSSPGETQRSIARRLGYSESWLSRIIASDAFQVRLASRIEKDIEPERREIYRLRFASIEEQARGILMASLQRISTMIEDPAGVPADLALKTATMTSKLLGYGARAEPPPARVEMHVHLEQLAGNLRRLNRAPVATIEHQPGVDGRPILNAERSEGVIPLGSVPLQESK